MLVLTPDTLRNPSILETRAVPRKFFGRVTVWPKSASFGTTLRLIAEMQFLRYLIALVPFCVPLVIWPQSAMPISQAPLAMVLLIGIVELRVLGLSDRARRRLMTEDAARAHLDTLAFRGRAVLRAIAARKDLAEGSLTLVIEQSELARIAPLSFVTVQSDTPDPHVLALDAGDRAVLEALFDAEMTERDLHRASLRLGKTLHQIQIEAQSVSAHARMAAWIDKAKRPEVTA